MPALAPVTPLRPGTTPAAPAVSPSGATAPLPSTPMAGDALVLSNVARAAWPRPQQRVDDPPIVEVIEGGVSVQTVASDLAPVFERLKGIDKKPFAIQEIHYLDLADGGRGHNMVFERDSGTLMPPVPDYFPLQRDPLTGDTNLKLQEARLRMSAGRYDIIFTVDGEGKPAFKKLMLDGRDITRLAGDYVKDKIKENPAVWGTAAAVAVAGAVAVAHQHVARTGKPIGFGVGNIKLLGNDTLAVRVRPRAELTGDSRFVRATGAEVGVSYHDGPLNVSGGVNYHLPSRSAELVATMGYQLNPTTSVSAYATHNTSTHQTTAGFLLIGTF